ncbi:MAG: hypothetical protein ABSE97_05280 [Verrucomicrobiota bacterium]
MEITKITKVELKDFISETLKQIIEGVAIAQEFGATRGALVNPKGLESTKAEYWDEATGEAASLVAFDVAVTAVEGKGTKGGIGVFTVPFALGSQGQSESSTSIVSRVKFSVPVHLPKSKALKKPKSRQAIMVSV